MVDRLREEHQKALLREQAQVDFERERVKSLMESFEEEKAAMQATIERLETENLNLSSASALTIVKDIVLTTTSDEPSGDEPSGDEPSGEDPATSSPRVEDAEPTATELTLSSIAGPPESTILAQLIKAQTEALAAQTQAAAAQHLPPLKTFTGEGRLSDADSFERWLENFEERAKLVG